MSYFNGKHAAITGAGSGIGRALAQALNTRGCNVWLSDVDSDGLQETIRLLDDQLGQVHSASVDVAKSEEVIAWSEQVAAAVPHLDLLVNNAGVTLVAGARYTTLDDFHWLMNINFWGVIHGCQAFLPLLEKAPRSHLVNLSSVFGLIGVPSQSAYNAAKFAVRGYSESLRQELDLIDSPVKVCCVHPGGIGTNIARRARNVDKSATPESQAESFEQFVRTSADEAANQILKAAERGKRRLLIGPDARLIHWVTRFFPENYHRLWRSNTDEISANL